MWVSMELWVNQAVRVAWRYGMPWVLGFTRWRGLAESGAASRLPCKGRPANQPNSRWYRPSPTKSPTIAVLYHASPPCSLRAQVAPPATAAHAVFAPHPPTCLTRGTHILVRTKTPTKIATPSYARAASLRACSAPSQRLQAGTCRMSATPRTSNLNMDTSQVRKSPHLQVALRSGKQLLPPRQHVPYERHTHHGTASGHPPQQRSPVYPNPYQTLPHLELALRPGQQLLPPRRHVPYERHALVRQPARDG